MIILAIDPGSKKSGWAIVRADPNVRTQYLAAGTMDNDPDAFFALRKIAWEWRALNQFAQVALAVEMPEGMVYKPFLGPSLLQTTRVAGGMSWTAHGWGWKVIELSAAKVRKALVGKASSPKKGVMDKLITEAVAANVDNMPKRSNVHCRDALALGIVASWELNKERGAA